MSLPGSWANPRCSPRTCCSACPRRSIAPGAGRKGSTSALGREPFAADSRRLTPIMQREFTTCSADETIALGRRLVAELAPPKLVLLRGELGAGKTTLIKGIATG